MRHGLGHLFGLGKRKCPSEPGQCSASGPDKQCDRRRTKFYDFLSRQAARYRRHHRVGGIFRRWSFRLRFSLRTKAVDLALGVIVTIVERYSGWSGKSDQSISTRFLQSAAFLHGISLCEQAISQAMYAQAGALVRQEMECIASMEEAKLGIRKENKAPNVNNVPKQLRRAYGQLSMMTHTSSTAMLKSLLANTSTPSGYISVVPQYNNEAARMLIGLHAALLIEFAVQLHILYLDSYGECFTPLEQDSLQLATRLLQEDGFLPKPPPDEVGIVPADDSEMSAAIDKARETLPSFLTILKEPTPRNCRLSVKVPFVEGGLSEHMWLTNLVVERNCISGLVANFPKLVTRPRFQQRVTITEDQVTDWMIEEDGQVHGAFTTRVLMKRGDSQAQPGPVVYEQEQEK